jgi:2',3'-cyclic-nucleotide 2'-phosphodiesterase (5'-nucleotidase family)
VPAIPETRAARGTELSLLYGANLQGEYENCGCPSHPLGGLARRATVVDRARGEADGVLVVDAGDMLVPALFHADNLAPPAPGENERRARLILAAYRRMGIDAVLPAERDLALGPEQLKKLFKSMAIPAIASNLVDGKGRPLFARDRIVTVAGLPVGIFGVVAAQPEDAGEWKRWPVHLTDPVTAGREEVASLRARGARMIVALLHLGMADAANKFLQEVPGIDWAVQGHTGMQLQPPSVVGHARLLDAMTMGKLVGRLDVHVVGGSTSWKDRGERAQLLTIIADHRQQLVDLARRAAEDKSNQLHDFYRQRREAIEKALATETTSAQALPAAIEGSWYEGTIIPLDESIPDQQATAQLVAAYNAENARRAKAGLAVGIMLTDRHARPDATSVRPGDAGQDKPTRYAGSAACAACHPSQARFFETTKHAHALAALAPRGRDRDPTCVGCHATGFMLPGGTWNVAIATDRLKNVGCESCHGPSLGHISLDDKKTTTHRQVPETVCRGCHTPDQTNGEFDYEKFRSAIVGAGHGA